MLPKSSVANNDPETKVLLRSIGHEFLLQLDDSTSRILPIEKVDGRYAMFFERELSFDPDLLFFSTHIILKAEDIQQNYLVEVEKCDTSGIVYSFITDIEKEVNQGVCKLRTLPEDCYVFYFKVFEDETIEQTTVEKDFSTWNDVMLIICLMIGAIIVIYALVRKKGSKTKTDIVNLGKFQFDQKGMKLTLKAQSIDLSSKETDLLLLLFSNENKTLEREFILKVVWGDDGDYVGRTLDVFVSKLRKKLEADPSLKIINIRGVGYRFVING